MMVFLTILWVAANCMSALAATASLVYDSSPNTIHPENLVVRPNGHILITSSNSPTLLSVDPSGILPAKEIYTFPRVGGLFGVAQIARDIYTVAAGNFSIADFSSTPGSWSVWRVDLTKPVPAVRQIVHIQDAKVLNGVAKIGRNTILQADSRRAGYYRINADTGATRFFGPLALAQTLPTHEAPDLGINGIKLLRAGQVVFTNSVLKLVARLDINSDGSPKGTATFFANSSSFGTPDDLSPTPAKGVVTVAESSVVTISPSGRAKQYNISVPQAKAMVFTAVVPVPDCLSEFYVTAVNIPADGLVNATGLLLRVTL